MPCPPRVIGPVAREPHVPALLRAACRAAAAAARRTALLRAQVGAWALAAPCRSCQVRVEEREQ